MWKALLIGASLVLTSCNRQIFDFKYKFEKAYVKWPDGSMKIIDVHKWCDYENSDQIQIISKDGATYLLHSANVVLVNDK